MGTLVCTGQEIPCHRAVLAEASPVFDSALSADMRESSEKRLEIEDAEPVTVQNMITFFYTGKLDNKITDRASLLSLADRYGVDELVKACSVVLLENLCSDNVVTVTRALKGLKDESGVRPLW